MISKNSKFVNKLRLVTKKLKTLLRRSNKHGNAAEPQTTPGTVQNYEMDENLANEALEAKIRQVIVEEYSKRVAVHNQAVSLRIHGHLTITPTSLSSFQWDPETPTNFYIEENDFFQNESISAHQKPERQIPV